MQHRTDIEHRADARHPGALAGLKLAVLEAIARDPEKQASAPAVAALLFARLNGATGEAIIRIETLAELAHLSARTVQRALAWLCAAGYVARRSRGESAANAYRIAACPSPRLARQACPVRVTGLAPISLMDDDRDDNGEPMAEYLAAARLAPEDPRWLRPEARREAAGWARIGLSHAEVLAELAAIAGRAASAPMSLAYFTAGLRALMARKERRAEPGRRSPRRVVPASPSWVSRAIGRVEPPAPPRESAEDWQAANLLREAAGGVGVAWLPGDTMDALKRWRGWGGVSVAEMLQAIARYRAARAGAPVDRPDRLDPHMIGQARAA